MLLHDKVKQLCILGFETYIFDFIIRNEVSGGIGFQVN